MTVKKYSIVHHTSDKVFVSILFYAQTNEFWAELQHDLIGLGIKNATIYFDFVIQNGRSNRILFSHFVDSILLQGMSLINDSSIDAIIEIFNKFLKANSHYVNVCQLPTREKKSILNMLGV